LLIDRGFAFIDIKLRVLPFYFFIKAGL